MHQESRPTNHVSILIYKYSYIAHCLGCLVAVHTRDPHGSGQFRVMTHLEMFDKDYLFACYALLSSLAIAE